MDDQSQPPAGDPHHVTPAPERQPDAERVDYQPASRGTRDHLEGRAILRRLEEEIRAEGRRALESEITSVLYTHERQRVRAVGLTAAELAERTNPAIQLWDPAHDRVWHVDDALRALELHGNVCRDSYAPRDRDKPIRWGLTRIMSLTLQTIESERPPPARRRARQR